MPYGDLHFEILGPITEVETIAKGRGIRQLAELRRRHGGRNWRKLKGVAPVRLEDGRLYRAEAHWYEAHGVGPQLIKIKRVLARLD